MALPLAATRPGRRRGLERGSRLGVRSGMADATHPIGRVGPGPGLPPTGAAAQPAGPGGGPHLGARDGSGSPHRGTFFAFFAFFAGGALHSALRSQGS